MSPSLFISLTVVADLVDILVSKNSGNLQNETSASLIEETCDKTNTVETAIKSSCDNEIEMKSKLCQAFSQCIYNKSLENIEESNVKLDEKFMTLEYEEPEIRNENEMKSKLLKIGSEL